MKKRKLQTWKSNGKVIKVKTVEQVVELKEDRSLFARLMMVSKSRPDIDIKEAIGLTVVPSKGPICFRWDNDALLLQEHVDAHP